MTLITPLAAHETVIYVITAPMTALEQAVAGERPVNQPTTAITKKMSTAKDVAIERICVRISRIPLCIAYFKVILQPVVFGR